MTSEIGTRFGQATSTDPDPLYLGAAEALVADAVTFEPPDDSIGASRIMGILITDWVGPVGARLRVYRTANTSTEIFNTRIEFASTPDLPTWVGFGDGLLILEPWVFKLTVSAGYFEGLLQVRDK